MADKQDRLKEGQKIGAHGRPVPLSENERKYHDWTKEECVQYLRDIASSNPDTFLSRNFFRSHSKISDSTWNRHFGTFQEYKRSGAMRSRLADAGKPGSPARMCTTSWWTPSGVGFSWKP